MNNISSNSLFLFFIFFFLSVCSLRAETNIRTTKLKTSTDIYKIHQSKGFDIQSILLLENLAGNSIPLSELSGIAWDNEKQILFIISDNGSLFHFQPIFENNSLQTVKLLSSFQLQDKYGGKLSGKLADSEGLALIKDKNNSINKLAVSFEREPRIIYYKLNGEHLSQEPISKPLLDKPNYQSENKQLESLAYHEKFGLISGPERPLLAGNNKIGIYAKHRLITQIVLSEPRYGSLVGMTELGNGDLLALERVFINVFAGLKFTLHHLTLNNDKFSQKQLLTISASDGFFNDNFEGITQHKENYFFMVSDDNDNPMQRTLLVYFRLPAL